MKLQITEHRAKEIDVPVPSFWVNPDRTKATGIINEQTIVHASNGFSFTYIQNGDPVIMRGDVETAVTIYEPCSEETFFEVYNAILQSISLTPTLKDA